MTIRLLRQFLQAGIEPLPALKTLNTAAMLRCQGGAGFTTIDLACLDRAEGVLTLYKYGAAPSYIKRQGAVARYRARASPPSTCCGWTAAPVRPRSINTARRRRI